jgi:hypothetical protein
MTADPDFPTCPHGIPWWKLRVRRVHGAAGASRVREVRCPAGCRALTETKLQRWLAPIKKKVPLPITNTTGVPK